MTALVAQEFATHEIPAGFLAAQFSIARGSVASLFDLYTKAGGASTGVWCFGVFASEFNLTRPIQGAPLGLAIEQPQTIEALMSLDEADQSTFMVHLTRENEATLAELVLRLRRA